MRRSVLAILTVFLGALLFVASPALAVPDVEIPVTVTDDYQFAGILGSDPSPDLVEVAAIGGECTVWFLDTTPDPDVRWPSGSDPPWWPTGGSVGVNYYTVSEGLPRPFNLRGVPADHIHVDMGTASKVIVCCSKRR